MTRAAVVTFHPVPDAGRDLAIRISWLNWVRLLRELRRRGAGARESGAFLLGRREGTRAVVRSFVFYDDVDPDALAAGFVHLSGEAMGAVWAACEARDEEVLADVHTHPYAAFHSEADQAHPMIATAGHAALVVPDYAARTFNLRDMRHYRYRGAKRWSDGPAPRAGLLHVHLGEGS